MSNICSYSMKIKGEKNKRDNFIGLLKRCVFNLEEDEEKDEYIIVEGGCAWSIRSALFTDGDIESELEKLNLDIEIFSEEVGNGFMEHFIVEKGEITLKECVDYICEYDEEKDEYIEKGGLDWVFSI